MLSFVQSCVIFGFGVVVSAALFSIFWPMIAARQAHKKELLISARKVIQETKYCPEKPEDNNHVNCPTCKGSVILYVHPLEVRELVRDLYDYIHGGN